MQFCGIKNNDLIFVKKDFKLEDLDKFPVPIVIHRDHAPFNETQFKVRRAWGICAIEKCSELIETIFNSQEFTEKIVANDFFDGEAAMLEDFCNIRLKNYVDKYVNCNEPSDDFKNVVISTTFHTDNKKIRFSLHAVSKIVGVVSQCFPDNNGLSPSFQE